MFQFVMVVCVVSLLMIACDLQRAKGNAFFFSWNTGVECQVVLGSLERLPAGATPEATSAVHSTKEIGMVQFSFRPPGADYLGFEATTEGISETACKAEELGF